MLLLKKMDTDQKQTGEGIVTAVAAQSEPTELDIIRTETVLSKLPVHNLSKKGRVDIQIKILGPKGEVELGWEVSYNERYGQARQLAYKVDTIIIDDRIDKVGRPTPKRICLGSLNQIAAELGLQTDHGTTNKNLKRALRQDALLGITAKFKYKGKDNVERSVEATFSRYSVIFTGEKFPDGTKADAVYIELNTTYQDVLNNAVVRPTDRLYKKELAPAAQRFYEIVSYKIYAALRFKHPVARLPYSEYCMFSAQQRYFDYDHFKKQMYKVHLPHLKSGYISKAYYEQATDSEGKRDWIMCYVPGPKAEQEFFIAHPELKPKEGNDKVGKSEKTPRRKSGPRQQRLQLKQVKEVDQAELTTAEVPISQHAPVIQAEAEAQVDETLLALLTKRGGIGEKKTRELLSNLKPDQQVIDQLEWGEHQVRMNPAKYENPSGFYIYLFEENLPVPASFETSRKRAACLEEEERGREAERLQGEYDLYKKSEIDRYITEHSHEFTL